MKIQIDIIYSFIFLSLVLFHNNSYGFTAGSDTSVSSPQASIYFPSSENNTNKIANYALMDNGFVMQDENTTCSTASLFVVDQFINLNGGRLYLNRDLEFGQNLNLSNGGKFYGNDHKITFPKTSSILEIPSSTKIGNKFDLIDQKQMTQKVYSTDWSYDDKYIVGVSKNDPADYELEIFYFDGDTLTSTLTKEIGKDIYSTQWHPNDYYIAIGKDSGTGKELQVYKWNVHNGTLTLSDEKEISYDVRAVAWSSTGQYLATTSYDDYLRVYSFSNGSLTLIDSISFSFANDASNNALSWQSDEKYLAVGTNCNKYLLIYSFDGANLTFITSKNPGHIKGVDWQPGTNRIIAALRNGTSKSVRIYEFSGSTLTEIGYISENNSFFSADWGISNMFTLGRGNTGGTEFRIYYFDDQQNKCFLIDGIERGAHVYTVKFSHDHQYILIGTSDYWVAVYGLTTYGTLLFDNVDLHLHCDIKLTVTTVFQGECTIDGNDNQLILDSDSKVEIADSGQLTLQNLEIIGLSDKNLYCATNNALLTLQDCKLILENDFEFDTGQLLFKSKNIIGGEKKFIYSSTMTSSIASDSILCIENNSTFKYAPKSESRNLLYMQDDTSSFYLDGCTLHSTKTGLQLTKGTLFIDNDVTINSEGIAISEAICFGDSNQNNNLNVKILSDAQLDVYGRLEYENTN